MRQQILCLMALCALFGCAKQDVQTAEYTSFEPVALYSSSSTNDDISPGNGISKVIEAQIMESIKKVRGVTGSMVIGFRDGDTNYMRGHYFFVGKKDRGSYIAIHLHSGMWIVPLELSDGYYLCSDIDRFKIKNFNYEYCGKSAEDLKILKNELDPIKKDLLPILAKYENGADINDIIVEVDRPIEGHLSGVYFTRKVVQDFGEIASLFFAVKHGGSWTIPKKLMGNGISICDSEIDWSSFPKKFLMDTFGITECDELSRK